ncbi:MAG: hypothetical protein SFW67_20960 [Myxococcaceae bacterium]|nr:hypothetical protein [Myxococcaceae bacterium]
MAREAMSAEHGWSAPAVPDSSTSCCSSSGDRRLSEKVVRSPKGRKTRLELLVSNHTSGRLTVESNESGDATSTAKRSGARSASDLGTSSPTTSDRYDTPPTTTAKATGPDASPRPARAKTSASGPSRRAPPKAAVVAPSTVTPT